MITNLIIDNYALIDKSVIDFKEGFTIITGETGAGKSIMLDALSLLTGVRADFKAMGTKERKTIVEATFSNPDQALKDLMEKDGLEWDDNQIILRREILPSGKSRGFVNDTPVNISVLSLISRNLFDIHSQNSNFLLNSPEQQLAIIDSFTSNANLLEEYRDTFKKYLSLRNRIKKIKEDSAHIRENRDFIIFRLEQLDKLKPKKGELTILEKEAEMLNDADKIKADLNEVSYLLGESQYSVLKNLQSASSIFNGLDLSLFNEDEENSLYQRIEDLKIEVRDITNSVQEYADKINSDPARIEKVQKRIDSIYELIKRFKVKDEEELVNLHNKLKEELSILQGENNDTSKLESQLKELGKIMKQKADILSATRETGAKRFAKEIEDKIIPLGMPNAKFKVEVTKGKLSSDGQDNVVFYCSFNKNHPMQPVAEIASGGEISRVMLGIKSVMAERMKIPTVIFDEIDTGVSGEIAHKMAKMMKEISRDTQVISITHIPQVAAAGDLHLRVYKADDADKTVSHIRLLSPRERVEEIAAMLSGNKINTVAMENAEILLNGF